MEHNKKIFKKNVIQWISALSIILLLVFQIYSLSSQYGHLSNILEGSYNESLSITVNKYRSLMYKTLPDVSLSFDSSGLIDNNDKSKNTIKLTKKNLDTSDLSMDELFYDINSYALSQVPLNINALDSIFSSILSEKNITSNYQIVVYSSGTDSIMGHTNDKLKKLKKKSQTSRLLLDSNKDISVYYSNPISYIYGEMFLYIIFNGLIFIGIILSFIYQLRLILKQKKIDRIKQDFIDSMTHELRHPLQGALSVAEILEKKYFAENPELRANAINRMKNNLQNISILLDSIVLRSYSQELYQSAEWKEGNLQKDINDIIGTYAIISNKNIKFFTNYDDISTKCWYDHLHLPNAVKNLIDNSIKYSGDSVDIEISIFKNNNNIYISVKDNGYGIKKEDILYVFDKFYKVPHTKKHYGLGLGLSYVKWVCEIHDGSISITSEYGVGSEFTIKFPIYNI